MNTTFPSPEGPQQSAPTPELMLPELAARQETADQIGRIAAKLFHGELHDPTRLSYAIESANGKPDGVEIMQLTDGNANSKKPTATTVHINVVQTDSANNAFVTVSRDTVNGRDLAKRGIVQGNTNGRHESREVADVRSAAARVLNAKRAQRSAAKAANNLRHAA